MKEKLKASQLKVVWLFGNTHEQQVVAKMKLHLMQCSFPSGPNICKGQSDTGQ